LSHALAQLARRSLKQAALNNVVKDSSHILCFVQYMLGLNRNLSSLRYHFPYLQSFAGNSQRRRYLSDNGLPYVVGCCPADQIRRASKQLL